jgi:SAM-dependent methyltransferase
MASAFHLEEQGDYQLVTVLDIDPRWIDVPYAPELTHAMVLVPGESVSTPVLEATDDMRLWLRVARGLPEISLDGLDVEAWLGIGSEAPTRLLQWHVQNGTPAAGKAALELELPVRAGQAFRVELRCGPGPEGDPRADWLAVVEFAVGRFDQLPVLRARSHGAWRLRNELAHFESAYQSDFYRERRVHRSSVAAAAVHPLSPQVAAIPPLDEAALARRLGEPAPWPGEDAFSYTHRLLRQLLPLPEPGFAQRLRDLHAAQPNRPVRMLSLCAGEAAVEGALLAEAGVPVDLCLVDVSEDLLESAASRMPPRVTVDRVLGSASDIGPGMGRFDVINITSGLHHLVELEKVLAAIAAMLAPQGEFWLIGEQVGRNGNRLWPDAREAANAVFRRWPEAKRRNLHSGEVDAEVPDIDHASGSFEGIRSQDIEAQVARHFLPQVVLLRDAFLWRLVDSSYAGNFDLADPQDLERLREAVLAEARHWLEGGRGTALDAAYRAKRALLAG